MEHGEAAQRQQQQPADAEERTLTITTISSWRRSSLRPSPCSGRSWIKIDNLETMLGPLRAYLRGYAGYPPDQQKDDLGRAVTNAGTGVSTQMVRFSTALSKESIVDIHDVVSLEKSQGPRPQHSRWRFK
ncbi:Aspartyl-tRNA synthetase, cytoplasmic [Panicum miliaceum]|uniref:Aspartyl-tRNA synthetase, cytoplasmic n=1 Tax=Panicum miliaceum TaxID=4540 RepID=A0A3L6SYW6_PANMI|nr:Aspartyl-tRNA synthetase, cytoplasmic [Panicum miliaceum]